jgi:NAD+ diphosphatase
MMLKKSPDAALPAMAFAVSRLDRMANARSDDAWIAALRAETRARCVLFDGDKAALSAAGGLALAASVPGDALFLGIDDDGQAWFAAQGPHEGAKSDLRSLAVSGALPAAQLGLLAQARSLLHWHERHRYCAHCGAATHAKDAGYKRVCPSCRAEHFPRTDPVVIIAVRRSNSLLLGRQASWPAGMYSTLAGFMEPGETIEDAARREVKEESGIEVGAIGIAANQPWPFPSSLMIGLIGEALTERITIDTKEIEDARWFSFADIEAMRRGVHGDGFKIPPAMAIAHRLILRALQES